VTRKQSSRRFARRQTESTHFLDLWRSANLHSAFCCLNEDLPFWSGTPINYFRVARVTTKNPDSLLPLRMT
jgi:hypothetical protein